MKFTVSELLVAGQHKWKERKKDLKNNNLGFILGMNSKERAEDNPGVPVEQMILHRGTTAGDFDRRYKEKWLKQ